MMGTQTGSARVGKRAPRWVRRVASPAGVFGVLVSAVMTVSGASTGAEAMRPRTTISVQAITGESPYTANCLPEKDKGDAAEDAEVEPAIAVDPDNSDHLIVAWQQDRFPEGGGARNDLVAESTDGGETWTTHQPPDLTACSGESSYSRASDPKVAIGPASGTRPGMAYLASLGLKPDRKSAAEQVSASHDGGATWDPPVRFVESTPGDGTGAYLEIEAIAPDPLDPSRVFYAYSDDGVVGSLELGAPPSINLPSIKFSRSRNSGRDWNLPEPAVKGEQLKTVIDLLAVPRPGSKSPILVIVYEEGRDILRSSPMSLKAAVSADLGEKWEIIAVGEVASPAPPVDSETGQFLAPALTSDATLGPDNEIFFVWRDPKTTTTGLTELWLRKYDPLTDTLGTPEVIHSSLDQPYQPSIAVSGDRTIGVSFYDFRSDVPGDPSFDAQRWLMYRPASTGPRWEEVPLGDPFDMRRAIKAPPLYFVGDYQQMVGLPHGFAATFTVTPPLGQDERGATDIYFARVKFLPAR